MPSTSSPNAVPRLPVFGWHALGGPRITSLPSVLDAPHTQLTTSGRAAIALALEALDVGKDDVVLVPTYHCPTMIAPVVGCGAKPLFYKLNELGNADLTWLEKADTRGVRALLAAHYFGIPRPLAALRAFCDAHGIALIEDCAHALFGRSEGRPIGQWGDISIASLTKFLPVQEGGVIASRNLPLDCLAPTRRSILTEIKTLLDIIEIGSRYRRFAGFNTLLTGIFSFKHWIRSGQTSPSNPSTEAESQPDSDHALDRNLIGAHITHVSRWTVNAALRERIITQRRANFMRLVALLRDAPGGRPLLTILPPDCAPYVFPFVADNPDPCYRALRRSGLPLFRWDWLWPDMPNIPGDMGRIWSHTVFQLPCHQDLDDAALQCIAATVREVCSAHPT